VGPGKKMISNHIGGYMNLSFKPVCKTGERRKGGTATIAIQYYFNSDKGSLLGSGIAVPPKY
jgi:hypothetical protein